jgi:hypothetical protein
MEADNFVAWIDRESQVLVWKEISCIDLKQLAAT